MSCCDCTNTYDLGCFNPCDTIAFGTADQTGAHTLEYSPYPGRSLTATENFTALGSLEITDDGTVFQAGYSYEVQVTNPDGSAWTRTIEGTEYDCFIFTLTKNTTIV